LRGSSRELSKSFYKLVLPDDVDADLYLDPVNGSEIQHLQIFPDSILLNAIKEVNVTS